MRMHTFASQVTMQIFVKTFNGKTRTIDCDPYDTIGSIKLLIEKSDGITKDQQRLIHGGRQLADCRTIVDYNIGPYSTLHLMSRLYSCKCSCNHN